MTAMNAIETLFNRLQDELARVDAVIGETTAGSFDLIVKMTHYLVSAGGKRLRPILTILCSQIFGYQGERHIRLAAAVEFIHSATLLHDDVVDSSDLRRGKPTANHVWGNQASVLVGDFLLSQAFQLMVADGSLAVLALLSRTSAIIAEGEIKQLSFLRDPTLTVEQYESIIQAKTAQLFAASCQMGALITHQSAEMVQAMECFGMNLGIAFQMADDMLDYLSDADQLGKSIGDDFREGKMTLPAILTRQAASEEERATIDRLFAEGNPTDADLLLFQSWMHRYDIATKGTAIAESYIDQARQALRNVPESEVKDLLMKLLDFVVKRLY
jgi:octaprenyl-diphosphate synthase